MNLYPIIKVPKGIKEIKNSEVRVEDVYGLQLPQKKEKEIKLDLWTLILFCIFLPFVMKMIFLPIELILIRGIGISARIVDTPINVLIGVVVITVIVGTLIKSEKENKEIQEQYKLNLANFNKLENKLNNNQSVQIFHRKKALNNYFKKSTGYFIRSSTTILNGISESYFYSVLNKEFDDIQIVRGGQIKLNNQKDSIGYYSCDFILEDDVGLKMNIEIDEPYIGQSRKPIHYIDVDKDRDNIYLENGWIVVRFTEKQVVSYPNECCQIITDLFEQIYDIAKKRIDIDTHQINEKQWTENEASLLEWDKYRENYIRAYPDKISIEDLKFEKNYLNPLEEKFWNDRYKDDDLPF